MKKIYLPLLLAALLTGCGGGGSETGDVSATPSGSADTEVTANSTNTSSSIKPFSAPVLSESDKKDYLDAINDARRVQRDCGRIVGTNSNGVPIKVYDGEETMPAVADLIWNDKLYSAAAEHSEDLATSDTFSHDGSGTNSDWTAQELELGKGSTTKERIENNGYAWRAIGENVAAGTNTDTAVEVVQQWIDSPGHCANLMNSTYTEVGMAMVENSDSFYTHYWTQNFGTPR